MCDPAKLTKLYLDVLTEELQAEHAEAHDDGTVYASVDGLPLVVTNHAPHDPEYFHLWTLVPIEVEPSTLGRLCDDVNRRVFGTKLMPLEDGHCVCSIEMPAAGDSCLPDREFLAQILPSALGLIAVTLEETRIALTLYGIEEASAGASSAA